MPRVGLSPAAVVATAGDLADEVGLEALTLAAVAERCDVRLPSLYKHVAGLDAVRRGIAVSAVSELGAVMASAAVGRARGDALRGMAEAYRAYAAEHPGRYAATLRAADASDADHVAAGEAALQVIAAVLAGYGITGQQSIDATRLLRSTLHGFVSLEAAGGFGMPGVDRSFRRAVSALDDVFGRWLEV